MKYDPNDRKYWSVDRAGAGRPPVPEASSSDEEDTYSRTPPMWPSNTHQHTNSIVTDLRQLIDAQKESNGWISPVFWGGMLAWLGFLLVPIVPLMGYLVRILDRGLENETELPRFDDWQSLFVDGVKACGIVAIYLLIPIAVIGIVVSPIFVAGLTLQGGGGQGLFETISGFAGMVAGSLMFVFFMMMIYYVMTMFLLILSYVVPPALANFAATRRFAAAFDRQAILRTAFNGRYTFAWGISIAIAVGFLVVTMFLWAFPGIGEIFSVFLGTGALILSSFVWGRGSAPTIERQHDPDLATDEQAESQSNAAPEREEIEPEI